MSKCTGELRDSQIDVPITTTVHCASVFTPQRPPKSKTCLHRRHRRWCNHCTPHTSDRYTPVPFPEYAWKHGWKQDTVRNVVYGQQGSTALQCGRGPTGVTAPTVPSFRQWWRQLRTSQCLLKHAAPSFLTQQLRQASRLDATRKVLVLPVLVWLVLVAVLVLMVLTTYMPLWP